jgi:hypothetical protein
MSMYRPNNFNKRVAFSVCNKSSYPCPEYYEIIGLTPTTTTTTTTIPTVTSYALINDYEIVVIQNNINMTLNYNTTIDNNFILGTIGAGGGGGGGRAGASNGGGGGGGFIFISNLIFNQNSTFNLISGTPGLGGGSGDSGSIGNPSEIQIYDTNNNYYIKAYGGSAGWRDGAGIGGTFEYNLNGLTDISIWAGNGGNGGDNSNGFNGSVSTGINPMPSFLFTSRIFGISSLYSGGGGGSYDGDETPSSAYFAGFPGSASGVGGRQGPWPKDGASVDSFQELGVWRGLQGLEPGSGGGSGGAIPSNWSYEDVMSGEPVDWTFYSGGTGGYGLNVALVKRTNNNKNYFNYNSNLTFIETSSYYVWYASKGIVQFKTPFTITPNYNLTCVLVGGGGGGGASNGGVSSGGGSGGGISYMPNLTLNTNEYFVSVIGIGGKGGVVGNTTGYNGTATTLTYCNSANTALWFTTATGGNGGNDNTRGSNGTDPIGMATPLWGYGLGKPNRTTDENGVTAYNGIGILYGGDGGDETDGQHGNLTVAHDSNSTTVLPIPQELLNLNIPEIKNFYGGGGGGGKASNEEQDYNGGDGGRSDGSGGARGVREGGGPYEGQKGFGYGAGGGAGGLDGSTEFNGGDGSDGLFLIYMLKTPSTCNVTTTPFSITSNTTNAISGFSSDNQYYYSIFTVPGEYQFYINSSSLNLYIICVAGGGGGGGSNNGISSGGGGGGAVYLLPNYIVSKGNTLSAYVGRGGTGGPIESSGTAGENSYVKFLSNNVELVNCQGGQPGNANARGLGGVILTPPGISSSINGGNGGDQSNGLNSYYSIGNNNSLNVPNILLNQHPSYISNYYSGGGGGGKADNQDNGWTGGQGGLGLNSGNGGLRGVIQNNSGSLATGQPGTNYGGGGGAAGWSGEWPGGNGANGIIIIYCKVCK